MLISATVALLVARFGARFARPLRRLFGMPDYQAYLEHQSRCHAGTPVLSEKEFVKLELERKYAGGGGRCC